MKQGDLLGPELFDFFMAAVMESWRARSSYELCSFRTRRDFQMTGRRHSAAGEEFSIGGLEYADDAGIPFCSRTDAVEQIPLAMRHFGCWGLQVHAGVLDPLVHSGLLDSSVLEPVKGSKSEVLYCSKPRHTYSNPLTFDGADLSPILLPDHGFMPIVSTFPYLGDIVTRYGGDHAAVTARIESGNRAFGALRSCLFSSNKVTREAKKVVYEAVVLNISLYGCESWSLTEVLHLQLRRMHAWHLRSMCRVTLKHVWDHRISIHELGQRLQLDSIDMYVARRQLRWIGHVVRMDFDSRLPRRMLTAWVPSRRAIGAPRMTYGRSIFKQLAKFDIDPARWHQLAADRAAWHETLRSGLAPPAFRPTLSPRISRSKPKRACTAVTMARIDTSLRLLA